MKLSGAQREMQKQANEMGYFPDEADVLAIDAASRFRVESGQFKGYALDFAGGDARLKLDVKELFNRCITDVMEGKLTATEKRAAEAARLGSSVCLKLERTGVDAISASPLQLQCRKCGLVWSVKKPSASRLPSGYWKCGNGCNAQSL